MRRFLRAGLMLAIATAAPAGAEGARLSRPAHAADGGFPAAEEKYLTAAATGEAGSVLDLARFYMANGLWVEALARLEGLQSPEALLLSATCDYRMGRYGAVVDRLSAAESGDALKAISLARLGAYRDAGEAFLSMPAPAPERNLAADYFLARAESLAADGDAEQAGEALSRIAPDLAARRFIASKIRMLNDDKVGARLLMKRAANGEGEWAMRARVALLAEAGEIDQLEALALEWSGGAFDRDLQSALGRLRLAGNDFDRGFRAYRFIVDHYPRSDAALASQEAIAASLPRLFAADTGLHPRDAARLFFDNVEFAPPGRDGDALIRDAADRLKALGLYASAAALLDHQVFKRLRGAERARVAADLADLHLAGKRPQEALRVIRSTRIAGLGEDVLNRRRAIEATALAELGETDNALALLSGATSGEELLMRADINWKRRAWAEAAQDYSSWFADEAARSGSAPGVAVRAATAYLLAGDRNGYRAFAQTAQEKLDGAAEADLIRSLGDVDSERFLSRFMSDYRRAYANARP